MNWEYEYNRLVNSALQLNKMYKKKSKMIEKLEKWLEEQQINSVDLDEWTIIQVRDKILELKGEDKE